MGLDLSYHQLELAYSLIALLSGYLLGSIPFGLLLTRLFGLGDIRSIGSGNIGATNVLRTGNKGLAAATLALDMLKGTAAVLLAGTLVQPAFADMFQRGAIEGIGTYDEGAAFASAFLPLYAGLGAFLGHLFPVWLRFKGGKGVATYIGVLLGIAWPFALLFAAVWLVTAWLSRYSSFSALVAAAVMPLVVAVSNDTRPYLLLMLPMSLLLFIKHRDNIRRLLSGTESRIGDKGERKES